jgi:hypothetical protein
VKWSIAERTLLLFCVQVGRVGEFSAGEDREGLKLKVVKNQVWQLRR